MTDDKINPPGYVDSLYGAVGLGDMNGHVDYTNIMNSIVNNNFNYTSINSTQTHPAPIYTTTNTSFPWISTTQNNKPLMVQGDAEFTGDLMIKGKSLIESLEKIEEKLAILRPNYELEEKWENLRDLRKQYMQLEKEILEKEQIWSVLKK
jgi:hypothetical protein